MISEYKILIVDDDPTMLFLHQTLLKKVGITSNVFCSHNGEHALAFINSCKPNTSFHVLLDINMPVMNGWEFLEVLQQSHANHHINVYVVSSGQGDEMLRCHEFRQVVAFLPKPLTLMDCYFIQAQIKLGENT